MAVVVEHSAILQRLLGRRALAGRLQAIAEGRAEELDVDPVEDPGAAADLVGYLKGVPRESLPARRLRLAVTARTRDHAVDRLDAHASADRELAAHLCGVLELDEAVPWLETRLQDRNRRVRLASARALGRIGGTRGAEALLRAADRARIPASRLTVELAKAAPHLFLEEAVADPEWEAVRPLLIAALGLRGHGRTSLEDLLSRVPVTGPADLRALCHVISKLGDRSAVPWLFGLLDHDDQDVRAAADHALRRIHRTAFGRPALGPLTLVGAGA